MKNKIKKFGALFMALMLIISGFGNLGAVLAEDVPQDNNIYLDNGYTEPMVLDDPVEFDYVKYMVENYKHYTDGNIASDIETSLMLYKKNSAITLNFINPGKQSKKHSAYLKDYFNSILENDEEITTDIGPILDSISNDVVSMGFSFYISPLFKKAIDTGSAIYLTSDLFLKEYSKIKNKFFSNTETDYNAKNKFLSIVTNDNSSSGYHNDSHIFMNTFPNIANQTLKNQDLFSMKNFSMYNNRNMANVNTNIKLFISALEKVEANLVAKIFKNSPDNLYTFIEAFNRLEPEATALLEYDHTKEFLPDNNINFKEQKTIGTKNVIRPYVEEKDLKEFDELGKYFNNLKNPYDLENYPYTEEQLQEMLEEKKNYTDEEWQKLYDEYEKEISKAKETDEYKEKTKRYEELLSLFDVSKLDKSSDTYKTLKNVEIFLNSDKWSITPLTTYVGNVGTQTETLEFKTIRQEDPNMFIGEEKVLVEGKNGEKVTTTTYEVDEKTGELKNPVSEEKITDPVDEVILVGTKVKSEDPKINADEYTPEGKDLTVNVGDEPKAEDAINNKGKLPEGTKYEWKETPDTTKPGKKPTVVVVTYPDGTKDEVPVNINVIDPKTDAEKNPANKPTKTEVEDKNKLTPEEKDKVEEEVKKVNPEAKDIEVKDNGDTTITYPDGSTNELSQDDTVYEKEKEDIPLTPLTPAEPVEPKKEYSKEPKVDPIYEGDTKITGKGEPRSEIEIRLPNHKTVYGTTDRDGYFEIETKIKLYEDEKVYVTQIEYGKEPSKEIVETVRRSYGHRNDKKDTKKNTTSTSDVIGVINSVKEKLITSDHSSYIVGYPNGNFGPNNTITRAEVTTIFARLSKDQRANNNIAFKDVKSTDWFNRAVKIGVSQGFINGYGDGTFKPDKPITRAEFASVIATYANKTASSNAFNDVNGWSVDAIDTAYANGWMQGNKGTFRPNDPLTRAEAVTVINRMLNRQADRTFIANAINSHAARVYKDINSNQWYFYDVYAASWGHNYTIENGMEKWTGLNGKAFTIR